MVYFMGKMNCAADARNHQSGATIGSTNVLPFFVAFRGVPKQDKIKNTTIVINRIACVQAYTTSVTAAPRPKSFLNVFIMW